MHPYSACVLGVLYVKCLNLVNTKRYSLPPSEVSSGWCAVFCDIHTAQWWSFLAVHVSVKAVS